MPRKNRIKLSEPTFLDAFQRFIMYKRSDGLQEKTLTTYIHHFEAICKHIDEDTPLSELTEERLRQMFSEMAGTALSRNSIRSYSATLKSFLSWCSKRGIHEVKIPLFKGEETIPETYTEEELKRLLKPPLKSCTYAEYRNWVIVNLLINNGVRASTVRAIQNRDVHLSDDSIVLRHTKTRKVITIPLSPKLKRTLVDYMAIRKGEPEEYLFADVNGGRMSESCLRNALIRYNQSRGCSTGIHKYRHTFARMYLVDCGGDALKLQKLLGHSTLDMTKHYVQIFNKDLVKDFQNHSPLEKLTESKRIKKG